MADAGRPHSTTVQCRCRCCTRMPPDWERRRVRNDDSVVLWVRYRRRGVWLPGDVGQAVEARLAPRIAAAPLTVLRAGASRQRDIDRRSIARGAAAVARHRVGRARQSVRSPRAGCRGAAARMAVPLLRTDECGAIQLATNGRTLLVRTAGGGEGSLTAGPPRRAWWLATPLPSVRVSPARAAGRPLPAASPQRRTGE